MPDAVAGEDDDEEDNEDAAAAGGRPVGAIDVGDDEVDEGPANDMSGRDNERLLVGLAPVLPAGRSSLLEEVDVSDGGGDGDDERDTRATIVLGRPLSFAGCCDGSCVDADDGVVTAVTRRTGFVSSTSLGVKETLLACFGRDLSSSNGTPSLSSSSPSKSFIIRRMAC